MGLVKRNGVYWADYRDARGRRIRKSLRTRDRVLARKSLEELEQQPAEQLPFKEFVRRWVQWKRYESDTPIKPRTAKFIQLAAKRFIAEFGDLDADDIPQDRVEAYKTRRRREVAPQTLNNDLDSFRNLLRFGLDQRLIGRAPRVNRIRVKSKRIPKELSREQLERLLDHVAGDRLEPIVRLALYAGLRAEETIYLQWGDVDLDHGLIHVTAKPGWSPKSSAERTVPIPQTFVEWLKTYRNHLSFHAPRDWLCQRDPTIGAQWERIWMGQCVKKLFEDAELQLPLGTRHKLHLLRGTYATTCLRGGADLESLRANLGHSDVKVTAMYLNATDESRRRAVSALDDLLP